MAISLLFLSGWLVHTRRERSDRGRNANLLLNDEGWNWHLNEVQEERKERYKKDIERKMLERKIDRPLKRHGYI